MTTFQFLPTPSSGNFAIRRLNLESDVMPSRADGGNGGRTRTDAVVKHHIALVAVSYTHLDVYKRQEIQREVYDQHLKEGVQYNSWRGMKASEVAQSIERQYTVSL